MLKSIVLAAALALPIAVSSHQLPMDPAETQVRPSSTSSSCCWVYAMGMWWCCPCG
jgi:hypothetical protein